MTKRDSFAVLWCALVASACVWGSAFVYVAQHISTAEPHCPVATNSPAPNPTTTFISAVETRAAEMRLETIVSVQGTWDTHQTEAIATWQTHGTGLLEKGSLDQEKNPEP